MMNQSFTETKKVCSSSTTLFEDKLLSPMDKNTKHYSSKKHFCNTCKKEIDSDISRVLLMRNRDGASNLLCFHFFFPCWDMELLCQKYPDLVIERLGFSYPENVVIKENSIADMQKNLKYWV